MVSSFSLGFGVCFLGIFNNATSIFAYLLRGMEKLIRSVRLEVVGDGATEPVFWGVP